jgi:hypothetical protein
MNQSKMWTAIGLRNIFACIKGIYGNATINPTPNNDLESGLYYIGEECKDEFENTDRYIINIYDYNYGPQCHK